MKRRIQTIFIDEVSVISVVYLIFYYRSAAYVWHFHPISRNLSLLIYILRTIQLIRAEFQQVTNHVGQIKDTNGEWRLNDIYHEIGNMSRTIIEQHIEKNTLVEFFYHLWEKNKVLMYFDKLFEKELKFECMRISLSEWILRTKIPGTNKSGLVLIKKKKWFPYIESYGLEKGLQVDGYGSSGFWLISGIYNWVLVNLLKLREPIIIRTYGTDTMAKSSVMSAVDRFKGFTGKGKTRNEYKFKAIQNDSNKDHGTPCTIGIFYGSGKISFKATERSELFFLNSSDFSRSQFLIYNYHTKQPLEDRVLEQLRLKRVKIIGHGPNVPRWKPTRFMYRSLVQLSCKLLYKALSEILKGRWIGAYYIEKLLLLVKEYCYWYDFYSEHNIKINIGKSNFTIGQILATDSLNGISLGYQYSISNINFPSASLSAGEDVLFYFSADYKDLIQCRNAPVKSFVRTGYIYDSAFEEIAHSDQVHTIRKQLHDNGAEFILSFFDETPKNFWFTGYSDEELTREYKFLLKWLLADKSLGVIFKPKRSNNLFKRLNKIDHLIHEAMLTRRCRFLTSKTNVGSIYPGEAALISDLSIGKLLGCTAAMEAQLIGIPAVLIDEEGYRTHPFYQWGEDKVIFDSWETLKTAVDRYRSKPEELLRFGQWTHVLDMLDPYRDGKGSLRMAYYIKMIYDALQSGKSKAEAISFAYESVKRIC